jgi:hypothetical protein
LPEFGSTAASQLGSKYDGSRVGIRAKIIPIDDVTVANIVEPITSHADQDPWPFNPDRVQRMTPPRTVIGHRQRSTPEASSTNSWLAIGFVVSEPNCHGPSTCDLARFYMTEIVPLDGTRATNCHYRVVKV